MTTSFNGTTGITFPDASTQSNSQVGMKNRIIDGGFTINQRGYVSGTSLSSGTYGHDRWKGGASAGTYTFTQGALGVNTTITITAGSIIQVIEGCNLPEGGTYVLSWTGTAQGRLNGGTFGSSGTVTVTGWVAGTNLNVEFNTGTCGSVQLEKGSTATSFDYRPYGTELMLCQRYFETAYDIVGLTWFDQSWFSGTVTATGTYYCSVPFKISKRTNTATVTTFRLGETNFTSAAPTVGNTTNVGFAVNKVANGTGTGSFIFTYYVSNEL
jgi:hypothetical protein